MAMLYNTQGRREGGGLKPPPEMCGGGPTAPQPITIYIYSYFSENRLNLMYSNVELL